MDAYRYAAPLGITCETGHQSFGVSERSHRLLSLAAVAERFDYAHAALAVLLGPNRLPVSEARSADIENLGFERGHRTVRVVGKRNKPAVIPLVPRTARTIDMAIGERSSGPILLRRGGDRVDRRTAHRGSSPSPSEPGSGTSTRTCFDRRAAQVVVAFVVGG